MKPIYIALIVFVLWNVIVFAVYGADKRRAKKGNWRISEKTLLLLAFFMGGTGALLGMSCFHHKTQHKKFTIGVPLLTLLNYACIGTAIWFFVKH